jgi:hypothetical protein
VLGTVYDLSNNKKSVEISYSTERRGPPRTNFIIAATLSYNGPEGQLNFAESQIQSQDSPLGTLLSVVLKTDPVAGNTNLSIFLPPISFGNNDTQTFATYLVKSQVIPQTPGCGMTYQVESLTGVARQIVDDTTPT